MDSLIIDCFYFRQMTYLREVISVSCPQNSEYDQEIPNSQTVYKPVAQRGEPHNNH